MTMIKLHSTVKRRMVYNLDHQNAKKQKIELVLAASPLESKAGLRRHILRLPRALQLNAGECSKELPRWVLEIAQIKEACKRGWLRVEYLKSNNKPSATIPVQSAEQKPASGAGGKKKQERK